MQYDNQTRPISLYTIVHQRYPIVKKYKKQCANSIKGSMVNKLLMIHSQLI